MSIILGSTAAIAIGFLGKEIAKEGLEAVVKKGFASVEDLFTPSDKQDEDQAQVPVSTNSNETDYSPKTFRP